jgi:hypothetical protein
VRDPAAEEGVALSGSTVVKWDRPNGSTRLGRVVSVAILAPHGAPLRDTWISERVVRRGPFALTSPLSHVGGC